MHTASRRQRTVTARLREWQDARLLRELDYERWPDEAENRRMVTGRREVITHLALARLDKVRLERRREGGDLLCLVVLDGARRASYTAEWGAEVDYQSDDDVRWVLGSAAHLLDPSSLLAALELRAERRDTLAGRRVVVAAGRERPSVVSPLGPAEEHELWVDEERGAVLRVVGYAAGRQARVHELLDVVFDVEIGDDVFEFAPPAEEVHGVGLSEAARLASFAVWALPRVAQEITYRPARREQGRPESLTILYSDVMLVETPAHEAGGWTSYEPPRAIERSGRTYFLTEGSIDFALEETAVSITSPDATHDDLFDLVDCLVRVDA